MIKSKKCINLSNLFWSRTLHISGRYSGV